MQILGKWTKDPQVVKEGVKEFYKNRLTTTLELGVRLDNIQFQQISKEDNYMLINRFEETEIKAAVQECGSSKSLGQ